MQPPLSAEAEPARSAAMLEECRDERFLYMISCFRPRLKRCIRVHPVLDWLPSLSAEEKERVRVAALQRGEVEGAEELLRAVERGPRGPGWFTEFLLALKKGGCDLAACYVNPSQLPSPREEDDHDLCVHLVQLLHGTLVDNMQTRHVAAKCLELGIFQEEDLVGVGEPYWQPNRAQPLLGAVEWRVATGGLASAEMNVHNPA